MEEMRLKRSVRSDHKEDAYREMRNMGFIYRWVVLKILSLYPSGFCGNPSDNTTQGRKESPSSWGSNTFHQRSSAHARVFPSKLFAYLSICLSIYLSSLLSLIYWASIYDIFEQEIYWRTFPVDHLVNLFRKLDTITLVLVACCSWLMPTCQSQL